MTPEVAELYEQIENRASVLQDMIVKKYANGTTRFRGTGKVERVFKNKLIAICEAPLLSGNDLELHTHPGTEILMVGEGHIVVSIDNEDYELKKEQAIIIERNIPHSVKYLADSVVYAATMPPDKAYP